MASPPRSDASRAAARATGRGADEAPARVAVRIVAASGHLPSGAKAVAEPILRATRQAREKAEATRDGEIAVYAAVSFDASTRTWTRPDNADVTWTQGTLDGNAPADLVLDLPAGALPLGRLVPDRVTRWRSATPGVRTESVR